jgi:hypothetical protein
MSIQPVVYHGGNTAVFLGDRVEKRGLLRKRLGRVNYVPGVSKPNQDMEFNGLVYVGIELEDGGIIAALVDPKTFSLKENIRLLDRNSDPILEIQPGEEFDG